MKQLLVIFALVILAGGCSKGRTPAEDLQQIYTDIRAANQAENFQKGYDIASKGLERYPGTWELLERRVFSAQRLSNFDSMIADCTEALKTAPPDVRWRFLSLRAQAREAQEKYAEAEVDYSEACKVLPPTTNKRAAETVWRFRARNLLRANRIEESLPCLEQALKLVPDSGPALGGRVVAYARLGDKEKYARDYHALKKYPNVFALISEVLKNEKIAPPPEPKKK